MSKATIEIGKTVRVFQGVHTGFIGIFIGTPPGYLGICDNHPSMPCIIKNDKGESVETFYDSIELWKNNNEKENNLQPGDKCCVINGKYKGELCTIIEKTSKYLFYSVRLESDGSTVSNVAVLDLLPIKQGGIKNE